MLLAESKGTHVHCIHMYHLFCDALAHVIYSGVSGQCSHTIIINDFPPGEIVHVILNDSIQKLSWLDCNCLIVDLSFNNTGKWRRQI